MKSKGLKIFLAIIVVVIVVFGIAGFKVYKDGFKIYTYATENLIQDQLGEIIAEEENVNGELSIETISIEQYGDYYYGFYLIGDDSESQCTIATYTMDKKIGKHNVYNLHKIMKSSNSVSMVEAEVNGDSEYLTLLSTATGEYESINILSATSQEVIDNITLTDEGIEQIGGKKVKENIYIIDYKPENGEKVSVELVRKGE